MSISIKRLLVGRPLSNSRMANERLTKVKALAVFSSDALSSVAYATDEITIALAAAGAVALSFQLPITIAILGLLLILTFSYRQTIHAYPSGGGAYIVAKDNLGEIPGLIAGSALLLDYVLTVAVSITAGVAQLTSAFPILNEHKVILSLLFIAIVTVTNLRGVRDSGTIFALPTYIFIFSLLIMIVVGTVKFFITGSHIITPHINPPSGGFELLTIFLVLKAFASGCTALTGVEAISNGVPAFQAPEAKNARTTLLWMSATLFTLFLGMGVLAKLYGAVGGEQQTVISLLGTAIYGRSGLNGILYYVMQFSTTLILILAANTSYADFPRLSSLLGRDGYAPRMLAMLGDRLVYSNGIIILGILASMLVITFRGETHLIIPLYAVGVFLSFTLSQSGMVRHWIKSKESGYKRSMFINGLGAIVTGIATLVIGNEKFNWHFKTTSTFPYFSLTGGAWIVIILIPIMVFIFMSIKRHYTAIADELRFEGTPCLDKVNPTIIIPIAGLSKVVVSTIQYAKSLSDNVIVVHISLDEERAKRLKATYESWCTDTKFVILPSPYRSIITPLLKYINHVDKKLGPGEMLMVLIPEFVTKKWWHNILHNQTGFLLKNLLVWRKDIVVATVPYHLHK